MILLKFATEIKGDSTIKGHENWINISSFQLGVGRSVTSGGGGKVACSLVLPPSFFLFF